MRVWVRWRLLPCRFSLKIWWIHITNYLGNYYFKDIHSLVFCNVLWEIFTGNDKVPLMTQHAERRMTLQMFFKPFSTSKHLRKKMF